MKRFSQRSLTLTIVQFLAMVLVIFTGPLIPSNLFLGLLALFGLVLLVSTILKLESEEKILNKSFNNYNQYQKKTKRLIPFVY